MNYNREIINDSGIGLLEMGNGEVAYMKKLDRAAMEDLAGNEDIPVDSGWAVFSAGGDPLAICDSPESAYGYVNEMDLVAVSLH